MRSVGVLMLVAALAGCGDDTTSGNNGEMGAGGAGGTDLSAPTGDLLNCGVTFGGFASGQTQELVFACPCGCVIDSMEESNVNSLWGSTLSSGASWTPMSGVALGADLRYSGSVVQAGLYSAGPANQFFLDGDFDLLLDYDMVAKPPGQGHLVLGVRDPGVVMNIQTYDVERQQASDGTESYASMLGGVPNVTIPTTATHGTLRITREGYKYTTYGDGNMVTTLIAQKAGRVAVTATAVLSDCALSDGGASCEWQPRFHDMRLASGTIVNLPN